MIRPMTVSEKILAEHAGLHEVEPGQLINARLDLVLGNDITAPMGIEEFRRVGLPRFSTRPKWSWFLIISFRTRISNRPSNAS